jgi:predicted Zn-dependent protease
MKERIFQTLSDLRAYARQKGYEATFLLHEEDSHLMRFANSAISLNTNEHLLRLEITAYRGKKRASFELITDLSKQEEIKQGVDTAAEMAQHAQPLNYQPTIPIFSDTFTDESAYDPALAEISNAERLAYFNRASAGLESQTQNIASIHNLQLSGIFSSGTNIIAQANTRSEHIQYFKTSDAQVTAVLSHARLKWEVNAEQSAQSKADLDPKAVQRDLAYLVHHYQQDTPTQVPLGSYDIVFGGSAIADLLNYMNWIGFNGGMMKRGFSFMKEENVGKPAFSNKLTLVDDPRRRETFPFGRDLTGMPRQPYPLIKEGIFQGFVWAQDDADEFNAQPTGHTLPHKSLVVTGGDFPASTLEELVNAQREKDLLYIPYLHYMNIVNPSRGIVTGSSRFGALLLKADGSVAVPYNVRLTHSLLDIFGDKVAWFSQATLPFNTSSSYGGRNPTAIIVPAFMRVNDLAISQSNSSY